jgi:acetyl esterase/lipase
MRPSFRTRRAVQLGLTANALRPLRGSYTAFPAFFAGWLTAELAPHLLALTCIDTAGHIARHGLRPREDAAAIGMAAVSAAGLAALTVAAQRSRGEVEAALREGLDENYLDLLDRRPTSEDLATPWRNLVNPFRLRDPEVRIERDIAYAPGGRRFLLDIYRPAGPRQSSPVLLQVHGGGWMIGRKDDQGIPLMLHMARRGWICVSINYPLSPKSRWPAHVVAAKRALAWVRDNIAEYGGDPAFIATTGGSAGGHLSALLALTPNDSEWQPGFAEADTTVQACVPHYGAYDFASQTDSKAARLLQRGLLAKYVVGKDPVEFADVYRAASPLSRVNADAPPFFVIHGAHDSLIPAADAREFVRRLRQCSRQPVAYAEISGAQHAFDIFPSIRSAHVVRGVQRFLEWSYASSRAGSGAGAAESRSGVMPNVTSHP